MESDNQIEVIQHQEPKQNIEGEIICVECNIKTAGIVTTENPWYIYMITLVGLFIIGKYFIQLAPFVFLTMKNQIRRCPECHDIIETKNMFSVEKLAEDIITFKLSDIVIVLSRKNAYIALSVLAFILLIMVYQNNSGTESKAVIKPSNYFWVLNKNRWGKNNFQLGAVLGRLWVKAIAK